MKKIKRTSGFLQLRKKRKKRVEELISKKKEQTQPEEQAKPKPNKKTSFSYWLLLRCPFCLLTLLCSFTIKIKNKNNKIFIKTHLFTKPLIINIVFPVENKNCILFF